MANMQVGATASLAARGCGSLTHNRSSHSDSFKCRSALLVRAEALHAFHPPWGPFRFLSFSRFVLAERGLPGWLACLAAWLPPWLPACPPARPPVCLPGRLTVWSGIIFRETVLCKHLIIMMAIVIMMLLIVVILVVLLIIQIIVMIIQIRALGRQAARGGGMGLQQARRRPDGDGTNDVLVL